MIGIIVAVNDDCVIGRDGVIPWKYPGDLRRFARVTAGSTVIMGRATWESIPPKFRPLRGRRNIVVSAGYLDATHATPPGTSAGTTIVRNLDHAMKHADAARPIWFIGGARIYHAAMMLDVVGVIDITYVPDEVDVRGAVVFPIHLVREEGWIEGPLLQHEDEPALKRRLYTRRPR